MKNILEQFLDVMEVSYTKTFADKLYYEHPHKNNMYGLKKMLEVYGLKPLGVFINNMSLSSLNYPCILHTHGDFVIALECRDSHITYLQQGRQNTVTHEEFKQMWSGNALVIEETTDASEPNYKSHKKDEWISRAQTYCVPTILFFVIVLGLTSNFYTIGLPNILRLFFNLLGLLCCIMLMQKQLHSNSFYGDRICSLFHHADCNSILDGPKAKVFGISWSEIGLGYFIANILLLSIFPVLSSILSFINWIAMIYGFWSIYYQWNIAKNWCVLCVIVQAIIWVTGIIAVFSCLVTSFDFNVINCLYSCSVFIICIIIIHVFSLDYTKEEERTRVVQQYHALKANGDVASALFKKNEYYTVSEKDSSILFGNPKSKIRVTILSNAHCNPCARMHTEVEKLLRFSKNDICVQYIFSSFSEELEDSSRYLIAVYFNNSKEYAFERYSAWYTKDKFRYKEVEKKYDLQIHTDIVEEELQKHRKWRSSTGLSATPTVLVNGFELPKEYSLSELSMLTEFKIGQLKKKTT
jgi:uncharacterized membrane protein